MKTTKITHPHGVVEGEFTIEELKDILSHIHTLEKSMCAKIKQDVKPEENTPPLKGSEFKNSDVDLYNKAMAIPPYLIRQYILERKDYIHSTNEMERHFLGREIKSTGEDAKAYRTFFGKTRRIRKVIEKEKHGKWMADKRTHNDGYYCIYTFKMGVLP